MAKPIPFQDILEAFEFVDSAGLGENGAVLSMSTGKIYLRSGLGGFDELEELDNESAEDGGPLIPIPNKRALDLGKPLVLAFARKCLPDDYDDRIYLRRTRRLSEFSDVVTTPKCAETLV